MGLNFPCELTQIITITCVFCKGKGRGRDSRRQGKKRIGEKWWPANLWSNTATPPSTSTTTLTMASKFSSILSPLLSLFSNYAFLTRFCAPIFIAFQVLKFQLFSLTSIPPDQQKVSSFSQNSLLIEVATFFKFEFCIIYVCAF